MSQTFFRVQTHYVNASHIRQYPHAVAGDQEDALKIALKQYTPLDNPTPRSGDVTIIAGHANGVGKELYEPLWDDLYHVSKQTGTFRIRGIWMADVAWQGESGVMNEQKLGNDPSWHDHVRDLLHIVNLFRKELPRPLIGVGHSMGGNNIVNLALMHPRLLSGIILIDPVVQKTPTQKGNYFPAVLSTSRRDIWPSREEAKAAFARNKFYQSWDPRVFDLWIEHGLRELPTAVYSSSDSATAKKVRSQNVPAIPPSKTPTPPGAPSPTPVTLTSTKYQEVFTFLRGNYPSKDTPLEDYEPTRTTHPDLPGALQEKPFYRPEAITTFQQLPHLRPPCLYIFASDQSGLSEPRMVQERMEVTGTGVGGNGGVAAGAVKAVDIKEAGHFVPFEKPGEVAENIGGWLAPILEGWKREEEHERMTWGRVEAREKRVFSEDRMFWTRWIRERYEREEAERKAAASKL